jgi:single-strand DNA-binding protein
MDRLVISGVVLKKEVKDKVTEITVSGKNGRFFRARLKALGAMQERMEAVEEGKPYLFYGGLLARKTQEGKETFELGVTRAIPLAHPVSENPQGPYLDGAVNQVELQGYLGGDALVKYIPIQSEDGEDVVSITLFRVAVRKGEERTAWVQVKAWGLEEEIADLLRKGTPVYVQGEYRLEKWEKDGQTVYSPSIIAKRVVVGARREKDLPPDLPF